MSMVSGKTITQTVTLGSVNSYPTYASPLTITSTGAVSAGAGDRAGDGIDGGIAGYGSIDNAGVISGGLASAERPYLGGAGISLSDGGRITNTGAIAGGIGLNGGYGIVMSAGGGIANNGAITGAAGETTSGYDYKYYGGGGGILLYAGGSITNTGTIAGGPGGGGDYPAPGAWGSAFRSAGSSPMAALATRQR